MKGNKIEKMARLAKLRSQTKKAAKEERNVGRKMWEGYRPSVINFDKDKKKCEQKQKNALRSYVGD